MTVTGQAADSATAARMMRKMDVAAIVVLGGDGTHRVVVSECGNVPIAGVSTGTNNAFPDMREPTVTGLAVGLAVTGAVPADDRLRRQQAARCRRSTIGARSPWSMSRSCASGSSARARSGRPTGFRELFVAFGEPGSIGMSSIVGLLAPVKRSSPFGRRVIFERPEIAPFRAGGADRAGIDRERSASSGSRRSDFDTPTSLTVPAGSIALDGEREITFSERDRRLRDAARRRFSHHRRSGLHVACGEQRAGSSRPAGKLPIASQDREDIG